MTGRIEFDTLLYVAAEIDTAHQTKRGGTSLKTVTIMTNHTTTYTYEQLASDLNLWQEYIDPNGYMSDEEFFWTPVEDKIGMIETAFGPELIENAEGVN